MTLFFYIEWIYVMNMHKTRFNNIMNHLLTSSLKDVLFIYLLRWFKMKITITILYVNRTLTFSWYPYFVFVLGTLDLNNEIYKELATIHEWHIGGSSITWDCCFCSKVNIQAFHHLVFILLSKTFRNLPAKENIE